MQKFIKHKTFQRFSCYKSSKGDKSSIGRDALKTKEKFTAIEMFWKHEQNSFCYLAWMNSKVGGEKRCSVVPPDNEISLLF